MAIKAPKKLIEVALPLDAINVAAAREKSIRHGHPSTLHLWWARRPLAAARAVIFAQMVNDPGYERGLGRGVNKEKAAVERERLFKIIEDLVKWENTNNEEVLGRAREEIWKSWRETCRLNRDHPQAAELFNPEKLPAFHDPFAGGGALPLEAQRLGLESLRVGPESGRGDDLQGDDRDPAEVCWPPTGRAACRWRAASETCMRIGRGRRALRRTCGATARGCARRQRSASGTSTRKSRLRRRWRKDRPDLKPLRRKKLTVIAWLWARTCKSPNPAFSTCRGAARSNVHALHQGWEGGLCGAGDRWTAAIASSVKVGKPKMRGSEEWYQALARRELPMPDVGRSNPPSTSTPKAKPGEWVRV